MKQQVEQFRVPVLNSFSHPMRSCFTSFLSLYDDFCEACARRMKVCRDGDDAESAEFLHEARACADQMAQQMSATAAYHRGRVLGRPSDKGAETDALASAAQALYGLASRGRSFDIIFKLVEAERARSQDGVKWEQAAVHFHSTWLLAQQVLADLLAKEDAEASKAAARDAATTAAQRPEIADAPFADIVMVRINDKPFWVYYRDDEVLALLREPAGDREDSVALKLACDSDFGPCEVPPLTLGALRGLIWSYGCQAFVNMAARYEFIIGHKLSSPIPSLDLRRVV